MLAIQLAESIRSACERWATRPAITARGRTIGYTELAGRISALSAAYESLGIAPGDRVVCRMPTCPEHLVAACAAWERGAIHLGVQRDLTGSELARLVSATGAAAVLFEPQPSAGDDAAALRELRAAHPETIVIVHRRTPQTGEHALEELLSGRAPPVPAHRRAEADLLLLTSGTTGRPKAVMETLPGLWAKMQFFADAMCPTPQDVHLMYLPICHAFGLKLSLMALASGGRLVLMDRFSPTDVLGLVAGERVTFLPATPTHLKLLLAALDAESRVDSLRWIASAAAPLAPEVVADAYARLAPRMLYVYGCSEGFLTQTTTPADIRSGSAGAQVFSSPDPAIPPDGSLAILDLDHDVRLAADEVGEIAYGVSCPVRYWGEGEAAGSGWYRTGDLGRLDAGRRLFVSGRLKEVVNRGGLKVACGEIEAALGSDPDIVDCAVVPTPDAVLGEAICACVVAPDAKTPTLADVRSRLAAQLSRQKLPDELCVVDSIPRSPVGKIDRAALRELVVGGSLARDRLRPTAAIGRRT